MVPKSRLSIRETRDAHVIPNDFRQKSITSSFAVSLDKEVQ